jgi:hypothetical protein
MKVRLGVDIEAGDKGSQQGNNIPVERVTIER